MRNWSGGALRIGLSRHGIAVLRTGSAWSRASTVLTDQPQDADAFTTPERLALICRSVLADARCTRMPVTVILADDWVRLFMVTPPHNAASLRDCRAAAAMRFHALYGETIADWQLEADWHARQPFLACAAPRSLLTALNKAVLECKLYLMGVMPQFIVTWNTWRADLHADAWFGVVQQDTLTLGAIHQQRLRAVRAASIPPEDDGSAWLHEHVVREALRLNLPVPGQLQLCGECPTGWMTPHAASVAGKLTINQLPGAWPRSDDRAVSGAQTLALSGMRT